MAQYDVNQPPQKIPNKWVEDIDLRFFLNELVMFLWQVSNKLLSDNTSTDVSNISVLTEIAFLSNGGNAYLPKAAESKKRVTVKNTGVSSVTLLTDDSALIEGASSLVVTSGSFYTLSSDGDDWHIVG